MLDDLRDAQRIVPTEAKSDLEGPGTAATTDGGEGGDHTQMEQTDLRQKSADIVCALNFGLCLLHTPQSALAYLRCAAASNVALGTSMPAVRLQELTALPIPWLTCPPRHDEAFLISPEMT